MAYNTKQILLDVQQSPIPQYFNQTTDVYEPLLGENGAARHVLYGPDGNPISTTGNKLAVRASEIESQLTTIQGYVDGLETALGEVQDAPTANTLLARIKSLETKIDAIMAGTSPAAVQLTGSNFEQVPGSPIPSKGVLMGISDGTNLRALSGNLEGTLLASATRTATTDTPIQTNYNARGLILLLRVTANPGGTETLTISVFYKTTTGTASTNVIASFTTQANANTIYSLVICPGASGTPENTNWNKAYALPIPKTWIARITHSGTGSWTYCLDYVYLI